MEEHVALDGGLVEVLVVGADGVVGEVDELVADLLGVVVDGREADVALVVHPDDERVEVGHNHPLPDVELPLEDDKRVLDVLLGDPQRLLALDVVLDLYEVVVASYASPSRQPRRLEDPDVVVACQVVLMEEPLLVLGQQLLHLLEQLVAFLLLLLVLHHLALRLVLASLPLLFLLLFLLLGLLHSHSSELAVDGLQPLLVLLLGQALLVQLIRSQDFPFLVRDDLGVLLLVDDVIQILDVLHADRDGDFGAHLEVFEERLVLLDLLVLPGLGGVGVDLEDGEGLADLEVHFEGEVLVLIVEVEALRVVAVL